MEIELLRSLTDSGMTIRDISKETGKSYTTVRYWLKKYSLITKGTIRIGSRWTVSEVRKLCEEKSTVAEVLRSLGHTDSSGEYKALRSFAKKNDISLPRYKRNGMPRVYSQRIDDDDFFSKEVKRSGAGLRRRMIRLGVLYQCSCGQGPTWQGRPLVLQVDHIDGDSYNNVLTNLRFLCPNCHTQTDTFCGRNRSTTSKEED